MIYAHLSFYLTLWLLDIMEQNRIFFTATISLVLSIAACTLPTNRIDLHTTENPHLSANMWQMSASLRTLVDIYATIQTTPLDHDTVMKELDRLLFLSSSAGLLMENHSRHIYMIRFNQAVASARTAVEQTSVDIRPAAALINNCLYCHQNL